MIWRRLGSTDIGRIGLPRADAVVFLFEHETPRLLRRRSAEIANRILGALVEGATLAKDRFGKPVVTGAPLSISISHSSSRLVVALAAAPIGVDMEFLRYPERWRTLYDWITAPKDRLRAPTESDFLDGWTARESVAKIFGRALEHGVESVSIPPVRTRAYRRATLGAERFWIKPLPRWKEMVGCVALREPIVLRPYHVTDFADWCDE